VQGVEETAEGVTLAISLDSRIGTGEVTGVEDHRVLTNKPFTLQRYGYYDGARMRNADGSAEYRINEVFSGQFALIDDEQHPDATAEALADEFPEGTWFEVFDYGVGDEVRWPMAVSVTQRSPHTWDMSAGSGARVNLPTE
jgi:hypothetical protein